MKLSKTIIFKLNDNYMTPFLAYARKGNKTSFEKRLTPSTTDIWSKESRINLNELIFLNLNFLFSNRNLNKLITKIILDNLDKSSLSRLILSSISGRVYALSARDKGVKIYA